MFHHIGSQSLQILQRPRNAELMDLKLQKTNDIGEKTEKSIYNVSVTEIGATFSK